MLAGDMMPLDQWQRGDLPSRRADSPPLPSPGRGDWLSTSLIRRATNALLSHHHWAAFLPPSSMQEGLNRAESTWGGGALNLSKVAIQLVSRRV